MMNRTTLAAVPEPTYRTDFRVSHLEYHHEDGWTINLTHPGQPTDGEAAPRVEDIPAEIREYLIGWLSEGSA